ALSARAPPATERSQSAAVAIPTASSQRPPVQLASLSVASTERPARETDDKPARQAAQIYFGIQSMGGMLGTMQDWEPDDPLVIHGDATETTPPAATGGETIVAKGEQSSESHLKSPAERLGLVDKSRAKAEKCLANAIYFEARGEQVRGQIAVAQVVLNRV